MRMAKPPKRPVSQGGEVDMDLCVACSCEHPAEILQNNTNIALQCFRRCARSPAIAAAIRVPMCLLQSHRGPVSGLRSLDRLSPSRSAGLPANPANLVSCLDPYPILPSALPWRSLRRDSIGG